MISIRGAITVEENSKEAILNSTKELLKEIYLKNQLSQQEIISIFFSATKDLTKAYPAVAARALGIEEASLFCVQEMYVEGSMQRCIRILMHVNRDNNQCDAVHIYLKDAKKLRPDITN